MGLDAPTVGQAERSSERPEASTGLADPAPGTGLGRTQTIGSTAAASEARGAIVIAWVMLGAFLSFALEPLTGRMVLPKFGGSAHVWNVTMMGFQGLLLVGYAYAHAVAWRVGRRHLAFLLVPLAWLPIQFGGAAAPDAPLLVLTGRLLWHVGLPFMALTTTAIIAQAWWTRSALGEGQEPYRLYAASNVGSLAALLGYPLLIEPFLSLTVQRWAWTAGYAVYLLIAVFAWRALRPQAGNTGSEAVREPAGTGGQLGDGGGQPADGGGQLAHGRARLADGGVQLANGGAHLAEALRDLSPRLIVAWLALSAVPSAMLLAVTNHVAHEVGSFPLVWVGPLALYLGTYVVAFHTRSWSDRIVPYWPELLGMLFILGHAIHRLPMLAGYLVLFFLAVLIMHRTLYRLRPDPRQLTHFYLTIALGGWLGGMAVALVAPTVFDSLRELPLGVLAAALLLAWIARRTTLAWWRRRDWILRAGRGVVVLATLWLVASVVGAGQADGTLHAERSFYGIYQVRELGADHPHRVLVNGNTIHGVQFLEPELRGEPGAYYRSGGLIQALVALKPDRARIGVVGLGAGAVAAMADPGDSVVFYEIDPANEPIAREWFTFLDAAGESATVRTGDARLLLATETDRDPYDTLLVDAFSGDAVPVHLLTAEALGVYLDRLAPDGVLGFHISNRYSDFRGVLKALTDHHGLYGAWHFGPAEAYPLPRDTSAMVVGLARSENTLAPLVSSGWRPFGPGDGVAPTRLWTDDYVNILQPMLQKRSVTP